MWHLVWGISLGGKFGRKTDSYTLDHADWTSLLPLMIDDSVWLWIYGDIYEVITSNNHPKCPKFCTFFRPKMSLVVLLFKKLSVLSKVQTSDPPLNLLSDLQIPVGTDILVTHTPPVGYGDRCATGVRAGCVELLNIVQKRVKPKYHVYGHIHEGIETWYHRKRLNNLLLGIKCLCFYVFRVRSAVGRQDRIHKRFSLWYQLHAQQQAHCIWHPPPPRILEIK